jgi:DNA-binding response OmpR family regulator
LGDYETLEQEAHKLGGSGKVYGFEDISITGSALESSLRYGLSTPENLATLTNALLSAIEAALLDTPPAPTQIVVEKTIDEVVSPEESEPAVVIAYRPMILIAEDDPDMQNLLTHLLQDHAIVRCAGTARKAIEAATEQRFDLVLLDQQLPDRSGVEVLASIRRTISADACVVMLTATRTATEVQRLLAAGVQDYVLKPFEQDALVTRVLTHLHACAPSILIADDDPLIREIIRNKFQQRGLRVLTANNGAEALKLAQLTRPHVVILDCLMPRMDGMDVLAELRHDARTRNLPVIMLSARTSENEIAKAYRYGANDYIPKPFLPDDVISRCLSFMPASRVAA